MDLTTFIRRPVLSAVISVLIVLMGLVSLRGLPVEQYPDMAPPTVNVFTTYAGADAETVIKSVITPLEESINGVEGMIYMTSTASDTGEANVTVYFKNGVNPDMAAVNVQNRVQSALANLPAEVTRQGVTTEKEQNSELMTLALSSEDGSFDEIFLNNYMNINVVPRLRRISGVGKVSLFGSDYNMRLWLKPDKMAHYRLVPADIEAALAGQNIEAATGAFGENHDGAKVSAMKYRGRFSTPEEFGNIVLRSLPEGGILRLKDVADVEMGSENYNYANTLDGRPAALAMIKQRAGANASSIIEEIDRELERMAGQLPPGLKFHKVDDANRFLYAAIRVVVRTLCEAMILVILVVRLFLRDLRATLIPAVGLFVSLVGTFAFMRIAGFSINLLTLFALVLAIGTVVDDAIIVVEAARARFDRGCRSPFLAARDAMGNIARALAVSTLIFMAVFIPVSLIGGTSGAFYRQFGLTMAAAVGISAINALTLSPALCALLLRPHAEERGQGLAALAASMGRAFDAAFKAVSRAYVAAALWFLRRVYLAFVVIAVSGALLLVLVRITPTGLVPDEDTGMLFLTSSPA